MNNLQAFIDDSYTPNGIYVIAGAVATRENWRKFSEEWEVALRSGWGLVNNRAPQFKYVDMKFARKDNIPVFLNILEKYISGVFVSQLNIPDLIKAKSRIQIVNHSINSMFNSKSIHFYKYDVIDWKQYDPFMMAFKGFMDAFHHNRDKVFEAFRNEKVDFFFDVQHQKKLVFKMWDNYLMSKPEVIRNLYGAMPRFETDDNLLPLQGADLLAGWAKELLEVGKMNDFINLKMDKFIRRTHNKIQPFIVQHTEEHLFDNLLSEVRWETKGQNITIIKLPKNWQ